MYCQLIWIGREYKTSHVIDALQVSEIQDAILSTKITCIFRIPFFLPRLQASSGYHSFYQDYRHLLATLYDRSWSSSTESNSETNLV